MTWLRFLSQLASLRRLSRSAGRRKPLFRRVHLDFDLLERRWMPSAGITEFATTTGSAAPYGIVAGPDGDLWFTENAAHKVAKITPSGTVTEYSLPAGYSAAGGITAGPDGNLWITAETATAGALLKITTSGSITAYSTPGGSSSTPTSLAAGSDGNLWFTDAGTIALVQSTTSGSMTSYAATSGAPWGITAGPDGALWFSQNSVNKVGRITTAGSITEYTLSRGAGPISLTTGPDDAVWLTEQGANKIGRITTGGAITTFSIPTSNAGLQGITLGPDGALWFAENSTNKLGRITTDGVVSEYSPPTSSSGPEGVAAGPDGQLWFTENTASKIGKVSWIGGAGNPTPSTAPPTYDPALSGSAIDAGGDQVTIGPAMVSPATGGVQTLLPALNLSLNPGGDDGAGVDTVGLEYNTATISPQPVIEVLLATDPHGLVPNTVSAQLTWNNGTPQTAVSFDTYTGHSAGDVDALNVQVASAVTTTGYYPWSMTLTLTFTGVDTITRTVNGSTLVVANGSSDPYGQGWGIAGLDQLTSVTGGVLWVSGSGSGRFFANGGTAGTFNNPTNDFGTLTQNQSTLAYTYTTTNDTVWNFSSAGLLTSIVDPHGLTTTFAYLSSPTRLSTVTEPDGGVGTFSYNGSNQLSTITEPGSRVVTVSINGSGDLATITNPDGSLHSFTYSSHRLTNDQWGQQNVTYAYDATTGAVATVSLDGSTNWAITAAVRQGLATSPAKTQSQAVGLMTDPASHTATYTLSTLGEPTQVTQPGGINTGAQRDFAGNVTKGTDPDGNVTTATYDYSATGAGTVTKVQNADGSTNQYQYNSTFHLPTVEIDGNSNRTTISYNATSDVTTLTNALNQTTTETYYQTAGQSNGLLMNQTDPLGDTSSFAYDANRRMTQEITGYGTAQAVTATMIYDSAGNLLSETTGISSTAAYDHHATTSYAYDAMGRVTEVIQGYGTTDQRTSSTAYDAQGRVLSTTDERGTITSYGYDVQGRQTTVITGYGTALAVTTTMSYDSDGNLLSETTGISTTASYDHHSTTSYGYDALNRQTTVITGYGTAQAVTATMAYDNASNLLSETTGVSSTTAYDHHATTSYAYDSMNRQIQEITGYGTALAVTATMIYDSDGNLLSKTTGISTTTGYDNHATTSYGYDALTRQTQEIDAYGTSVQRTLTTVYDSAGRTLSVTDGAGNTTSYGYNSLGQRTTVIQGYGSAVASTATMIYDAAGNLLSETTGQSTTVAYAHTATTSYAYNTENQQTKVIQGYGSALASTTTMIYDAAGSLLSETTGISTTASYDHHATTSCGYDALGRQTTEIDGYGSAAQRTLTTVYDAAGAIEAQIDGLGNIVTMSYDALSRKLLQATTGGTTTFVYDAMGEAIGGTDPNNHSVTFVYDALGRKIASQDAKTGITSYSYDTENNEVTLTDSDHNTTTFVFNALGQETKETDPLGHSATFTYTGAGQLLSTTDRLGRRRDLSYDALERQTGEAWVVSGSTANTQTFTFDAACNQLTAADGNGAYTVTYDVLNRMTSQQQVFGQALTYTYDAASNVVARQDSQNGSLTSVYDSLNRLTSRQFGGPSLTTLRIDLTWTAADQLNCVNRYSDLGGTTLVGSSTYGYDTAGRLTHIQHKDASGANIANYTYAYDAASNVTSEDLNGSYTTYSYDTTNQLTTLTNGSGSTTYGYDSNGNRTNTGYQTGTDNQLTNDGTWTYTYDAEENLSQKAKGSNAEVVTYTYDNLNRLTQVQDWTSTGTTIVVYKYDVFGNRIEEDVTPPSGLTTTSRFVYDGKNAWTDLDGSNNLQMRRFYLNGADQLFARISSAGTAAWYLADHLGSVRDIENYTGTSSLDHLDYDGYGNVTSESQPTNGDRYKYTAREFDSATSLQYNRARYYDPKIGRWISQDPAGFTTGDCNLYRYVVNSPVDLVDLGGLKATTPYILKAVTVSPAVGRLSGGFCWVIQWTLNHPSNQHYAYIIQDITWTWQIASVANPRMPGPSNKVSPVHYWEAWEVEPGSRIPDPSQDTWSVQWPPPWQAQPAFPNTIGRITVVAYAEFFESKTRTLAGFTRLNPDTFANSLLATTRTSTSYGVSLSNCVARKLTVTWNSVFNIGITSVLVEEDDGTAGSPIP